MKNKYGPSIIQIKLPIEIKTQYAELYFTINDIDVIHHPERPAPSCQDPSNPAYSDPGDPEENEFYDFPDIEKQIRNKFDNIIQSLTSELESVIHKLKQIDLHPLLSKGNKDE